MTLREKLTVYVTHILNNSKDYNVEEVVNELVSCNYLICDPKNLDLKQYNWLAKLMQERKKELESINLSKVENL